MKLIYTSMLAFLLVFGMKQVPGTGNYSDIVYYFAKYYNLDPYLIHAIIIHESKYDPNAVSHKGAIGLMQIKPTTAKWLCRQYRLPYQIPQDLYKPIPNVHLGTLYLSYLHQKYRSYHKALGVYWLGFKKHYKLSLKTKKTVTSYSAKVIKCWQKYKNNKNTKRK